MKKIFCAVLIFAFAGNITFIGGAHAGLLQGRIINADGSPVAKKKITAEGVTATTNDFGGYELELKDGERELRVTIDGKQYATETVRVYSPRTKQNWKIEKNTLKKVR